MALRDTLAQLRQREEQNAQWERDKPKVIIDWQESVASLLEEIREYLGEYEADGSMSFTKSEVHLSEERLGKYRIDAMQISAPPAIIVVAPVGRLIVGATGRVDIYRQGRTGEADRIKILRISTSQTDPTPLWAVTTPPAIGMPISSAARRPNLEPLSKEVLEQSLEFLLNK
jgi:hypothetical protein